MNTASSPPLRMRNMELTRKQQCFPRQIHRTSLKENRLPNTLYIEADNTPKETKNGTVLCWGIWLLASLRSTNLKALEFQFPLVGHTHGGLDRFFSRLIVGLKGRSYLTLGDMAAVSQEALKSFSINWNHHGSSLDWAWVRQIFGIEFHRYRNVYAVRLQLDDHGLWIKWKQGWLPSRERVHIFTLGREFARKSSTEQPSAGEWYGDMSQGLSSLYWGWPSHL